MQTLIRQEQQPLNPSSVKTDSVVLRVSNLSKHFGGQQVLDGVCLELHRGEVVLLRGANGSGKTTLLNLLTGNLEPDTGIIELFTNGKAEDFRFPLAFWQKLNPFNHFTPEQVATEGVGRTWQDIRLFKTQTLLENITVATPQQLGENPLNTLLQRGLVKKQEKQIAQASKLMLAQLGLSGREQSSADKVSLGQSKRVAIARAVQAGAKILFLDEPLAGLDAPGIADVMELLTQLAHREGVTLVIIEHIFNIPRILELATTVWTLEGGKLTKESKEQVEDNIKQKQSLYQYLDKWFEHLAKDDQKIIITENLSGQATLSILSSEVNKSYQKVLDKPKEVVLEVSDLVVYQGQRLVIGEQRENGEIKGLSFKLHRGELGLLKSESGMLQAANGWGKTTLLEAIAGTIPIQRGSIRFQGRLINKFTPWKRVNLGLSFLQSRDNYFPSLTVKESLSLCGIQEIPRNLSHLIHKRVSYLSGGEKQKLILTCVMDKKTPLLLMDEPFSALDILEIDNLKKKIIEKIRDEQTILIAIPKPVAINYIGESL